MIRHTTKCMRPWRSFCTQYQYVGKQETQTVNCTATAPDWPRPVKLSYDVFEDPKRAAVSPPLVLLHGMFGSKKNFRSIAKALSRTGRKIVTVDLRNHGDSPRSMEMDYFIMSEDVSQLLQDLQLEEVNVLGHSMGGKVAMVLALTKPQIISKVIIEDVSPRQSGSSMISQGFLPAMQAVKFDSSLSVAEMRKAADIELESLVPVSMVREFLLDGITKDEYGLKWKFNLDAIQHNCLSLIDFPKLHSPFYGPALFLAGNQSTHIQQSDHSEITRLFPEADIQQMEAGHWIHSEKPLRFLDMVKYFLEN